MKALAFSLTILCFLLLGAHFLRAGWYIPLALALASPLLLFIRSVKSRYLLQVLLVAGTVEWIRTIVGTAMLRTETGQHWLRMAIILGIIVVLTLTTVLLLKHKALKKHFDR